jgi:hypothetical protein
VNNLIQINNSYKPDAKNADTASRLATPINISGVPFDGYSRGGGGGAVGG